MKITQGFLSLSSLNVFVTLINIISIFLIGRFGDEKILAAIFFSYSTLQILVNIATFRTDALIVRFGFTSERKANRSILVATQLLDLTGAVIYCCLALLLYELIKLWFAQKFSIDDYIGLFLLSWLVYVCKQTVYGLAVASGRFALIAVQGAIAAVARPSALLMFIALGFNVYTSAALMYFVSELLSFCLLIYGVRDLIANSEKRLLPVKFWSSVWHLYASSTLKIDDNNFNESLLPVIAEPKLAACLLLLRKAFGLVGMLVQPLSTLMMGKLSQLAARNIEEIKVAVARANGVILVLGCMYILVVSLFQEWLGKIAGFNDWLVPSELAVMFGVSLLLRYLLWWIQPVFTVFSIPLLYLFNALLIAFLASMYLMGASKLNVQNYIVYSIGFYFCINAIFMYRLKARLAISPEPI